LAEIFHRKGMISTTEIEFINSYNIYMNPYL